MSHQIGYHDRFGGQLGEAAYRYAWHGWPIVPGTRPRRRDQWPTPNEDLGPFHGALTTNDVCRSWAQHPHPVLLATGTGHLNVLRTRHQLGQRLLDRLTELGESGPIAVLPGGQWLFVLRAHQPDLGIIRRTVRHYGRDGHVPIPPTPFAGQPVIWHTDPAATAWQPFDPAPAYRALRTLLRARPATIDDEYPEVRRTAADERAETSLRLTLPIAW